MSRNSLVSTGGASGRTVAANEARARRAAKRVGLKARKSRWRFNTIDNWGGFRIIDPRRNWVVAGTRFDFTADDVIAFCADYAWQCRERGARSCASISAPSRSETQTKEG